MASWLAESNDGKPLVTTTISGLLPSNFPYERLPSSSSSSFLGDLFLRPESVLGLLLFYALVSKPMFKKIQKVCLPDPTVSTTLKACIAVHNLLLAVFSGIVAWKTWKIVIVDHLFTYGVYDTYCDPSKTLWTTTGFGSWAYLFYISKYYEFIDTWILVLKGKEPSFLQCYHHTGIALIMWIGIVSQSTSWLIWVVLLNSVIHTVMYAYFFIKTLRPTLHIPSAKYLTTAQITQFFLGIGGSSGVFILGKECDNVTSRFGLVCLNIYGAGLIALFMAFAKTKYKKK